ncbi:hypothetical protein [Sphingomonas sp. 3-13AW]|uniref:hypothetical protein n=1 Tax=Sphingomonas sp. 3-13AW TaxID=3050450 RepID=UPI003BB65C99
MDTIQSSEAIIIGETAGAEGEEQNVTLVVNLRVLNEQRLRRIAADRMSRSGFDVDPHHHMELPLHELAYEAIFGSNPDPLGPDEMGIEITSISNR